jgi:hypothetical protein
MFGTTDEHRLTLIKTDKGKERRKMQRKVGKKEEKPNMQRKADQVL